MVIEPKNQSPITTEVGGVMDLVVVPVFQTRDDYKARYGAEPPPPDPMRRAKHWFDPAYVGAIDDGEMVPYLTLAVHPSTGQPIPGPDGNPRLATIWLTKEEAGSVNIPAGTANEFPANMPVMRLAPIHPPVRPLHPDERLEFGMGGIVRVVNIRLREKALASADQWTAADRALLRKIAAKLGVEV